MEADAASVPIDVIIRCPRIDSTTLAVVGALAGQDGVCCRIVLVDTSEAKALSPAFTVETVVIRYPISEFNYSAAINCAIPVLRSKFVLICSSHSVIHSSQALLYASRLLESSDVVAAATFSDTSLDAVLSHSIVTAGTFNGWNGAWNTATLYRADLLRIRNFRTEVFSAEDQEWSRWAVENGLRIVHVMGAGLEIMNKRAMDQDKRVKEWACIAYFAAPQYMGIRFILSRFVLAIHSFAKGDLSNARFWTRVGIALSAARFRVPTGRSTY